MIVAQMASYPPRAASMLRAVAALAPQVDRLTLVLNEYAAPPPELAGFANVVPVLPERNLMDLGKFLPDPGGAEWVFLVDDDMIYPADYVAASLARMDALAGDRVVGGYHATIYRRPGPSFRPATTWRWLSGGFDPRRDRELIGFWKEAARARKVSQIGTGTAVVPARLMPPFAFMEGSERAVDIRFARWCHGEGITLAALPRPTRWLGETAHEESIYAAFTRSMPERKRAEIAAFAFAIEDPGAPL